MVAKKKKDAPASLYFAEEEVKADDESIPRLTDEQLDSLERKGSYTPKPETNTNRGTIQPSKVACDTSIGDKGEPVSVASGISVALGLREDRSYVNRFVQSRIDEDEIGSDFDERSFDFLSTGLRVGMVAAVFAFGWLGYGVLRILFAIRSFRS